MSESKNDERTRASKRTSAGTFKSIDFQIEEWLEEESEHEFSDIDSGGEDPDFEPEVENLEPDEINCGSDIEYCEQESDEVVTQTSSSSVSHFKGKNGFLWAVEEGPRATRTAVHNIIRLPRQNISRFERYMELFSKLFDDSMLQNLIKFTNQKLNTYRNKFKNSTRTELADVNTTEMKAFIGLLYYSSVFKCNDADSNVIFATDGTGHEIFRCAMSKYRFSCLINCLRFDDANTRQERLKSDTLAPISEMFDKFIANSQSQYHPGASLCIDEMLLPFRGRCKFIIYMPQKPAKYGIKIQILSDARTYYTYNAYIYHGRISDGLGLSEQERKMSVPTQSVLRLVQPVENSNRNITADNWFSSIPLMETLLKKKLTYLGTLKKNKAEIPPSFLPCKERQEGSSLYGFTKDFTLLSYVPKKNKCVLLISSSHHKRETDSDTGKPVAGVVGRADVLACFFFLSSILLYHGSSGRHRVWSSVFLAALSMLAKETGLTALLFNVAFDLYRCWHPHRSSSVKWRWRGDSSCGRVLRALAALVILAGARLALLQGTLPAFSPQDNPPAFHPSFSVRLMTFCYLAAFNWWLLLCPWTLSHDWQMGSVPLITSLWDLRNLLTCAAFIALLALSYRCLMDLELQRHTPALVGLMLLVLPYLPASNLLVTVGFVVAERVLYIPSVGSVIITVYGVQLMWHRRAGGRLLMLGVAVLVAGGVARTHLRNRDWRTRETLLRADLSVLPHNAKLHYNFANFLKDIEQQENAIKHYKEALKLWPSYASAHNNLGTLVLASGRAEHHFLQALKYNRDHVNAHYNLAKLYRKKNRIPESLKMLERCISLEPRFVQAYLELLLLKPEEEKRGVLGKLLELEPKNWEHYVLYGNWYRDRGLLPISLEYYTTAMRLSFSTSSGSARGEVLSLRAACLALRTAGQYSRMLQLLIRWHGVRGGAQPASRRVLAARAWRLRSELAERAALYARPRAHTESITSTCLHHSQLEVSADITNTLKQDDVESRLFRQKLPPRSGSTTNSADKILYKNNCQKNVQRKKSVSLSSQYKLTHNKSEIGHKKSCPLHKKKKIKDPEFPPYVSDHLIKTY